MDKEVKELIEEIKGFGDCGFFTMTTEERDLLLDYINQLETIIDKASDFLVDNSNINKETGELFDFDKPEELFKMLEEGGFNVNL